MSTDVEFPEPSAAETALQNEQVRLLQQQSKLLADASKQQSLLAPILFESAGIQPIYDDAGEIVGYEQIQDEATGLQKEINLQLLNRTKAALAGELPEDPALIRQIDESEETLRETLFKQLGPGYEVSSPGIESLSNFTKRKTELLDAARRGDLTLAEQLSLAQDAALTGKTTTGIGNVMGINQGALPFAQGFGATAYGYSNPINALRADRQAQFQASAYSAQQPGFGALLGPAAYLGGSLLGSGQESVFGRLLFGA